MKNPVFRAAFLLCLALLVELRAAGATSSELHVVASIKPIHSLVAAIMDGVGHPRLIMEGAGSPHTLALKPSRARDLQTADLVFWIGPELETFLAGPVRAIARHAEIVDLAKAKGVVLLGSRRGRISPTDGPMPEPDERSAHHRHGTHDPHIWLDPVNARALSAAIEAALIRRDPENAAIYRANGTALRRRLDRLTAEITAMLAPLRDRPFLVFHDAYQYFENRFGLHSQGSIVATPELPLGADRLRRIRDRILKFDAVCVFTEPQFRARITSVAVEKSRARLAVLDPLGANLAAGPDLYFELLRNIARSMQGCLSGID